MASYEAHDHGTRAGSGIADFNPYDGKKAPEIAVATGDTLSIYALDHSVFMSMSIAVPGGGGGPPTIADYDHDGLPEVGLAGQDYYTVFDPDCQATPRPGGKCARPHALRLRRRTARAPTTSSGRKQTQDHSSNITGSCVFDFPGAGTPEVVYADECFARVLSGFDGTVLFSQYHSSCTWIENPIVADVDGRLPLRDRRAVEPRVRHRQRRHRVRPARRERGRLDLRRRAVPGERRLRLGHVRPGLLPLHDHRRSAAR